MLRLKASSKVLSIIRSAPVIEVIEVQSTCQNQWPSVTSVVNSTGYCPSLGVGMQ